MPSISIVDRISRIHRGTFLRILLLVVVSLLALAALEFPVALRPTSFPLEIGDVASQNIQAPRSLAYESAHLTDLARKDAENGVAPIYLPADPAIARGQIERLQVALTFISTVRADAHASRQQQLEDLNKMMDIHLSAETAEIILNLSENRWDTIRQETISVLEQVMRNTIREDRLDEILRSIPTMISYSLTQEQAAIVTEIVSGFVVPNSLYSAEQTEATRKKLRDSVTPVIQSFVIGETIVSHGQVITPVIWEALEQYGLVQPKDNRQGLIASAALICLVSSFLGLYFFRRRPIPIDDPRSLLLISATFLLFFLGARFVIPNRTVIPYLYPLPAFGLTIAALYNLEIGLVLSLILSILSGYSLPNSLDLTMFYALSSLCGVLILGRAHRIANFFWSGIAIGFAGSAIILAYRLTESITDWVGLATLVGSAFLNGMASASLALLIQFLFSQMLGLTTALQLLEVSRPDYPLLQVLLRSAPGTYQHSLQVANLAEQAAEQIGADGLLTRVGAIYHDAGKAVNPLFFIENQVPGKLNPHNDVDAITSAATIIRHVEDGLLLARKYRLPPRIRDFICEHHGTLITRYQYTHAIDVAGGDADAVDMALFQYPGPRPQSRETALLMLADGCEARARAELPKDEKELRQLIKNVFDRCQRDGQLDDTRLTLRDLNLAAESFAGTLKGMYHARIAYPELRPKNAGADLPTQPNSRDSLPLIQPVASGADPAVKQP